jgi:glycosyltransferase involved in cell wall biosynthesis
VDSNKNLKSAQILRWYWKDDQNPRPTILRKALSFLNISVEDLELSRKPNYFQIMFFIAQNKSKFINCDAIYIQSFQNKLITFSWFIGIVFRKKVIFDFLASNYDAFLLSNKKKGNAGKIKFLLIDYISLRLPDYIMVDTEKNLNAYSRRYFITKKKFIVVPVGFDDSIINNEENRLLCSEGGEFRMVFWGNFLPIHGVDIVIDAAKKIYNLDKSINFNIFGPDERWHIDYIDSLRYHIPENITFHGYAKLEEIYEFTYNCHAVLGIFGKSEKMNNVIPCKVYEGLATGKPVITGESDAVKQQIKNIFYSRPGDSESLVEQILWIKDNYKFAYKKGLLGKKEVISKYTPRAISKKIKCLEAI